MTDRIYLERDQAVVKPYRKKAGYVTASLLKLFDLDFVSNATPGERDEGVPDLSLIPVIAEIFGVSCDELLRGERRSPEERAENVDASGTGTSQKGAKERRRILNMSMAGYKNQTYVAMGIAVLGLIAAMICNLVLLMPIVAFLVAAIFYLVAVVCEVIFVNMAFYSVSGDQMEENDVMQFHYQWSRFQKKIEENRQK